jgi:hypothetical protein
MPAFKGTKILGTLSGGVHPKGTAPVAGLIGTQGARTTDKKMVGKPTMSNTDGDTNNTYAKAMKRDKKRGGLEYKVKAFAKGGSTASKRADGVARKGKTRGKVC